MKKTLISTLSALAILATPCLTHAQNLLADPGFEAVGLPDWHLLGNSFRGNYQSHSPSYSLVMEAFRPNGVGGAYQILSAAPGEMWTLSAWLYIPDTFPIVGGCVSYLQLSFRDSTSTPLLNFDSPQLWAESKHDRWDMYTVSGEAPAGTTEVWVSAFLVGYEFDTGWTFVDDASATKVAPVPEPSALVFAGIGLATVFFLSGRLSRLRQ